MTDYDSPWKHVLARYFPAFLEFFFPAAYAGIDWTQGYTLLDKELQKVVRDAALGQRRADQLVRITGRDGAEDWVLVHVEVQGEDKPDFAQRMFVYNYTRCATFMIKRPASHPNRAARDLGGG